MIRQLSSSVIWLAMVALFAIPAIPAEAQQAGGRMQVFVPDIRPADDSNRRFGERVAERLRERINDLTTHAPVDEDDVDDAMDQYDLDMRRLSCAEARQLAVQLQAELVMCGEFEQAGDQMAVTASFISSSTGEAFEVEQLLVPTDETEAAGMIYEEFLGMVEESSTAFYCQQDFQSQNWESALNYCNRAIELNPDMVTTRMARGHVLREQGDMEAALEDFEHVLEMEPTHENALQNAGYVAAQVGNHEEARRYYTEYLRLNPENTAVRMREAYALAQAGDPYGALGLVEDGLEYDADNPDLHRQIANFAFSAADQARQEAEAEADADNGGLSQEVRELYTTAVNAYEFIFSAEGAEPQPREFRNTAAAYLQLGDVDGAIAVAERGLEEFDDQPVLWSIYADALQRQGETDRAIAALEEVKQIDPAYPNVAARQGRWLLDSGRQDEALAAFQEAIERGEQSPDNIANMLFGEGYRNGFEQQDYPHAIRFFEAAREFDVSPQMESQLDFWLGYSVFNRAMAIQEAGTVESARQSLPMFQRAIGLFESGREYAERTNINIQQFFDNSNTYIEIQEAIIARAGRN